MTEGEGGEGSGTRISRIVDRRGMLGGKEGVQVHNDAIGIVVAAVDLPFEQGEHWTYRIILPASIQSAMKRTGTRGPISSYPLRWRWSRASAKATWRICTSRITMWRKLPARTRC
jgi:hypothetical protein